MGCLPLASAIFEFAFGLRRPSQASLDLGSLRDELAFAPLWLLIVMTVAVGPAHAQLPFERAPIEYSKTPATDPVALLAARIESGVFSLEKDEEYGYLVSLLTELEIPISSQTLVFSKTSLQRHRISPANPRAIYFNDDSYVGWIPDGELIEIASTDPMLGSVFYTIDQSLDDQGGSITRRNERCLFCHGSSDTGRVPGLLMQSVYTNSDGNRVFPSKSLPTNSRGSLLGRWGGWFVTGTHGRQRHLGNLMVDSKSSVAIPDTDENANVVDLSRWLDATKYLSAHSDIVALLVLQHQVSIHNLLTDANHRARSQIYFAATENRQSGRRDEFLSEEDLAVLDQIAEEVVDGLLMINETRFSDRISGTSSFTQEFERRGPLDSTGRCLRQFDLKTKLFRYPCSYLIYSESFDALPKPVLSFVYRRLLDVLSSKDARDKYAHLTESDRYAILQILRETKAKLPAAWSDG
jgi:hypothetical protein